MKCTSFLIMSWASMLAGSISIPCLAQEQHLPWNVAMYFSPQVEQECEKDMVGLQTEISHYMASGLVNNHERASKILDQQILPRIRELQDSTCFDAVTAYYAYLGVQQLEVTYRNDFSSDIYQDPRRRVMSTLVLELYKKGLLKPLTHKLRSQLGQEYTKRVQGSESKYQVMGAYQCAATTVYFDPYLGPLDVGAVMIHELDHLLRDKISADQMTEQLGQAETDFLDELLAVIHAGYYQLKRSKIEKVSQTEVIGSGLRNLLGLKDQSSLRISNDLTLFERGGNLDDIVGIAFKRTGRFDPDFEPFLRSWIIPLESKKYTGKRVDNIYSLVSQSYFKQILPFLGELPGRLAVAPIMASPLARWMTGGGLAPSQDYLDEVSRAFRKILETQSQACTLASSNKAGNEGSPPARGIRPCLRPGHGI